MITERILIVEDDPVILEGLEEKLGREGYQIASARDGEEAKEKLSEEPPDLVILDLMLPRVDGLSVLRWFREHNTDVPVLILSARGQEGDKVEGLRAGADDYLAKPFGLDELIARIEALLRRIRGAEQSFTFGSIRIDFEKRKVFRDASEVVLSKKEMAILLFLVRHRNRIVSREQILSGVWGYTASSEARAVDFHLLNLRRKLEDDPKSPRHIVTRHGLGFQLCI